VVVYSFNRQLAIVMVWLPLGVAIATEMKRKGYKSVREIGVTGRG
jgi:hypothetical protein